MVEQNKGPKLRKLDMPDLTKEKAAFNSRIVGQEEAVDRFATLFGKIKSGIRSKAPGPLDIKFLAGPSGVGKTEMVYVLAGLLGEDEQQSQAKVIKINGGEYQESHAISRLLGSPPGYVGYRDPPLFSKENLDKHRIFYTDKAGKKRDVVIILIDEAEKANESLHRAFLSVMDKGQMDLANNTSVDFSNLLIFYTSNVGNQQVEQAGLSDNLSVANACNNRSCF